MQLVTMIKTSDGKLWPEEEKENASKHENDLVEQALKKDKEEKMFITLYKEAVNKAGIEASYNSNALTLAWSRIKSPFSQEELSRIIDWAYSYKGIHPDQSRFVFKTVNKIRILQEHKNDFLLLKDLL